MSGVLHGMLLAGTKLDDYSVYFDGSGDYLNLGNSSAVKLGSGDFTVEFWLYKTATAAYMTVGGDYSSGTNEVSMLFDGNGTKICWVTGPSFIITGGTTINNNSWYHIAFVRSSNTLKLYVNGVEDGSTTNSTNYNSGTNFLIGIDPQLLGTRYFSGYISNFRIVKSAVYTSAFTPPTSRLTAITNTSLLTCQDSTFKDNSSNNLTITANGNAAVDGLDPFS